MIKNDKDGEEVWKPIGKQFINFDANFGKQFKL